MFMFISTEYTQMKSSEFDFSLSIVCLCYCEHQFVTGSEQQLSLQVAKEHKTICLSLSKAG